MDGGHMDQRQDRAATAWCNLSGGAARQCADKADWLQPRVWSQGRRTLLTGSGAVGWGIGGGWQRVRWCEDAKRGYCRLLFGRRLASNDKNTDMCCGRVW